MARVAYGEVASEGYIRMRYDERKLDEVLRWVRIGMALQDACKMANVDPEDVETWEALFPYVKTKIEEAIVVYKKSLATLPGPSRG